MTWAPGLTARRRATSLKRSESYSLLEQDNCHICARPGKTSSSYHRVRDLVRPHGCGLCWVACVA